jgi:GST-like protein
MIKLFGFGSPNVLKVMIALEELELPYCFQMVDVVRGDQFSESFGAVTPNRKVPVIFDEDGPDGRPLTLWESGAILIYLAEKVGRLMPAVARDRATVLQWLMLQMASIGPMFGQQTHFRLYAPGEEHAYSRARYSTEVKRLYEVVEARLSESPFLGGKEYSIADVAAWPWLQRTELRGVDTAQLPSTCRWIDQVRARPAVARAKRDWDALEVPDLASVMREQPDLVDRYVGRGRYSRA